MNHKLGFGLNIDDKERTIRNEIEPIQSQYFITSNTKESVEKFETFLPVIFVVLFLLLLFAIYLINNYCLKSSKQSADAMCCMYSENELPRSSIYTNVVETGNLLPNRSGNYRRSTLSTNSYKYCEEPRNAYFHSHNPGNNYIARTFNHNYDKIYESHPSNLILALQAKNFINQSGKFVFVLERGSDI